MHVSIARAVVHGGNDEKRGGGTAVLLDVVDIVVVEETEVRGPCAAGGISDGQSVCFHWEHVFVLYRPRVSSVVQGGSGEKTGKRRK